MDNDPETFPPCYHDNRLRQLAAWVLHPAADADKLEPAECLAWLIGQGADAAFPAVLFRAVDLPVYGRPEWRLLGWREHSPPHLHDMGALLVAGLEAETVAELQAGQVVRLAVARRGNAWDIAVVWPEEGNS